jgi:hypothetical protein
VEQANAIIWCHLVEMMIVIVGLLVLHLELDKYGIYIVELIDFLKELGL